MGRAVQGGSGGAAGIVTRMQARGSAGAPGCGASEHEFGRARCGAAEARRKMQKHWLPLPVVWAGRWVGWLVVGRVGGWQASRGRHELHGARGSGGASTGRPPSPRPLGGCTHLGLHELGGAGAGPGAGAQRRVVHLVGHVHALRQQAQRSAAQHSIWPMQRGVACRGERSGRCTPALQRAAGLLLRHPATPERCTSEQVKKPTQDEGSSDPRQAICWPARPPTGSASMQRATPSIYRPTTSSASRE